MIDSCEIVSLRELARRIGKDADTVRRWRDELDLPVYDLGRNRHGVIWSEFLAWLESRRQNRSPSAMQSH